MKYKSFLILIFISSSIIAQSKAEKIDDLLKRYHEYGFLNGSVLVAEKGNVILKKGYGYANMEFDIPNESNTVHRIGSITKQFVATMVMQLVEEGQISINEKMTSYLKDYRKDTGDKVTIFHLLTHTSGIPSYTGYPGFWSDSSRNPYETEELIQKFCMGDLEFEPGSQFAYNNSGYFLLAKIIEEVTGKSYEENIQERIFDKVGMKNTYLERPSNIVKNRASGYDKVGMDYSNTRYMNVNNAFGAGDIISTVEDLYLWDRALYTENLISHESKKKIFTPFLSNYGFGWGISKVEKPGGDDSLTVYSHSGGINGFNSIIVRIINDEHLIVVINNTGGIPMGDITKGISNILYNQDYDYPKKPISSHLHAIIMEEGIEKAVKEYKEISEKEKDIFDLNERELNNLGYLLLGDGKIDEAIAIFRLNVDAYPDQWNVYDSMGEALMEKGETEKSIEFYKKSIELNPRNTGAYEKLKEMGITIEKPEDTYVSKELLKEYVGKYQLFPNFVIAITEDSGSLFAQATGQPKIQIFPETETIFYSKAVEAKIEFIPEDNVNINKIVLYQNGKEMPGKRVEK